MWPNKELHELPYFDIFLIGFFAVAALTLFIVAWSKEGSADMWYILLGSVGAGIVAMGVGWSYKKYRAAKGGIPRYNY